MFSTIIIWLGIVVTSYASAEYAYYALKSVFTQEGTFMNLFTNSFFAFGNFVAAGLMLHFVGV